MSLFNLMKRDLAGEAKTWVEEGLINSKQAQAICQKYNITYGDTEHKSLGYMALVTLGYLFFGIAIIILIGENWEEIPRSARMVSLITITAATNLLGVYWFVKDPKKATALFFLGGLFYGASIILIAQIYHLGEHMPDGLLWWTIGVMPFVYLTRSNWLMIFALALGSIWFYLELSLGFFKPAYLAVVVFSLYGALTWKSNLLTFVLSIFAAASFYMMGVYHYTDLNVIDAWIITGAILIAMYGYGIYLELHKKKHFQSYGSLLKLWCLRFTLLFMFLLTFSELWKYLLNKPVALSVLWFSIISLLIGFYFAVIRKQTTFISIWITIFIIITLLLIFANSSISYLHMQVFFNLLLLLTAIYLIMAGINHNISHHFFIGVSVIMLIAFSRYIDLVGNYIGASILFVIFAVILLGTSKYWKQQQGKNNA